MQKKSSAALLAVLYASALIAAFSENLVNVSLVDMMAEFGIGANTAQWLVTGYMLVTAIVVTISAFLYRFFGLRRLFFFGGCFLIAGSIVSITSASFPVLLIGRLDHSVGTGIFIPTMMSAVMAVARRKQIGTYLAIGGAMITLGPALAPVVSGVMVTGFGWRSAFYPPLIIMGLIMIAGFFLVRDVAEPVKLRLDVMSVAMSALGLFLFVYGLSIVSSAPLQATAFIVAGVAVLAGFAYRQFKIDNPVLDLRPMLNKRFRPSTLLVMVAMATTFSMSVLLPLYFQRSLGMDAFAAGALLLAPILINAFTSLVGGRVMAGSGAWPLLPIGFLIVAVGQAAIVVLSPNQTWLGVLVASVVVYAGVGVVLSPSQSAGLSRLDLSQHTYGVAILNTAIQVAASIGPSLFIGVMAARAGSVAAAGTSEPEAQAFGFSAAVLVATIIAIIGVVVSFVYSRSLRSAGRTVSAGPSPAQH
ncbi:MFS transporter [Flaviflexus ciconiae]|uniref:MFS transporter n=1 Tax=Flaviflexus ciconiae TaxID=2496867 RepID=A0A3Q9G5E7_9ACTO|nr:MFS transporter [Flaviflexus ciconiae]AZQ77839.1 MFS transporter [Flaviflexus ciconiae]